jgi:hypothetical protein
MKILLPPIFPRLKATSSSARVIYTFFTDIFSTDEDEPLFLEIKIKFFKLLKECRIALIQ